MVISFIRQPIFAGYIQIVLDPRKKPQIDGIKLSNELFAVRLSWGPTDEGMVSEFCHLLAKEKINMPFLSVERGEKGYRITCCVDKEQANDTKKLILDKYGNFHKDLEFIPHVGLLSIFPHQSSLKVLGVALSVFLKAGIGVFAVASSLSVLTFVTQYGGLESLVSMFEEEMELPQDHVPLRPEILVKQTDIIKEGE